METRQAPRVNISLKIISKPAEEYQQKFGLVCGKNFGATALDISELGMGLLCKYFLPKGLVIDIEIAGALFGINELMKVKGEIRYCNYIRNFGYRCGVRFLEISSHHKEAIGKFIAEHDRRKSPRIQLTE